MATETIIDPTVAMPGATSSSPALIEFRCTRCWNSNLAECSASGTSIECRSCGHEVIVPEATPERIARAQSLNQELLPAPTIDLRKELNTVLSDHDLIRLANEELRVPLDQQDFSDFPPASLWARFFAQMIDTIVFMTVFSLGVFISSFLFGVTPKHVRSVNGINTPDLIALGIIVALPTILYVVQMVMISYEGQTIGKKLLMVRIVTMRGKLPGFLQGVLLRNWGSGLLALFIPFFGLIDALFALGESKRSLHDLLSGTRVVQLI